MFCLALVLALTSCTTGTEDAKPQIRPSKPATHRSFPNARLKPPDHLSVTDFGPLPGGVPNIPGRSDREVDYGLGCGGVNFPHFLGTCQWVGVVRSDAMSVTSGVWESINEDGSTRHWRNSALLVMNFTEGNSHQVFPAPSNVGALWIESVERDVLRLTTREGTDLLFDVRALEYLENRPD